MVLNCHDFLPRSLDTLRKGYRFHAVGFHNFEGRRKRGAPYPARHTSSLTTSATACPNTIGTRSTKQIPLLFNA